MRKFLIAGLASMALAGFGSPSTADFVQKAAMSDMYEVQAGKLATEKGQSDAVKQGQSPRWTAKQAAWPG
jgi:predicted outer membrane protein